MTWLTFAAMLAAACVALLPIRLFLPDGLFTARDVSGTIWSGRVSDARIGPLLLGDLDLGMRWPGWLGFREAGMRSGALAGRLRPSNSGVAAQDVEGSLELNGEARAFGGERLDLSAVSLDWGDAGCHKASGRIRLQLLPQFAGVTLGQLLSGTPKCRDGRFELKLASQAGLESIEMELRAGGAFRTVMTIKPADPAAVPKLIAAGFVESPTGYKLEQSGRI